MPGHLCGGQMKTLGSQFSPLSVQIMGLDLRLTVLVAKTFTH